MSAAFVGMRRGPRTALLRCGLLAVGLLVVGACSSSGRFTPQAEKPTPWFCQMNESGDGWDCVRDAELARNPKPERLPGQVPAEEPEPALAAGSPAATATAAGEPGGAHTPPAAPAAAASSTTEPPAPSATLTLPEDGYTVQLIALANRDRAEKFAAEHGLDDALILSITREDAPYTVVLLGVYPTYEDAQAAAEARPESLASIKPWIRPIADLRARLAPDDGDG